MDKKRHPGKTSLFVISLLILLGPGPAFAHQCDPTDNDFAAARHTIAAVNTRIDTLEVSLIATLKKHAGQISAYIAQQTTAIGRMFDAQNQTNAQIARDLAEINATREFIPSNPACETISGVIGLNAARTASEDLSRRTTRGEIDRLSSSGAAADGQAEDLGIRWNQRTRLWCSPEERPDGAGRCSAVRQNHNADINPNSLFGHETLRDSTGQSAARDFATHVTTPIAPEPLPLNDVDSDEERRAHFKKLSALSRTALARRVFDQANAERQPSVALGDWAYALNPGRTDPQPAKGPLSAEGSRPAKGLISYRELLSVLIRERAENPNYHVELQAMEPANVQREMASVGALQLLMLYRISDQLEMQNAMTAASLAREVEEDINPPQPYPGTEKQ